MSVINSVNIINNFLIISLFSNFNSSIRILKKSFNSFIGFFPGFVSYLLVLRIEGKTSPHTHSAKFSALGIRDWSINIFISISFTNVVCG